MITNKSTIRKHRSSKSENVNYDFRLLFNRDPFSDRDEGQTPTNAELKADIYRQHVRLIIESKSYKDISLSGSLDLD